MEAIQEYIFATAAVLVLKTVFADAQPAPHDRDIPNHADDIIDYSTKPTQLSSTTDTEEPEMAEDDCAK